MLGGDCVSCGCYKKEQINNALGIYRESKGFKKDEYITPIISRERQTIKASGIHLKVLRRDNYICQLCHSKNTSINPLQVHHIIPISEQLENHGSMKNLITLCTKCHRDRAHLGCTTNLDRSLIPLFQEIVNKNTAN